MIKSKYKISAIKDSMYGLNTGLDKSEKWISKLKRRSEENKKWCMNREKST